MADEPNPWPELEKALAMGSESTRNEAVVQALVERLQGAIGTLHLIDPETGHLKIAVGLGLPPVVREKVEVVPIGKGMAGIAAERREPVQVCNLQTDASGVVRPGAKDTKMAGSVAVPMFDGETLVGVLGVGKPEEYEFSEAEIGVVEDVGRKLVARMG